MSPEGRPLSWCTLRRAAGGGFPEDSLGKHFTRLWALGQGSPQQLLRGEDLRGREGQHQLPPGTPEECPWYPGLGVHQGYPHKTAGNMQGNMQAVQEASFPSAQAPAPGSVAAEMGSAATPHVGPEWGPSPPWPSFAPLWIGGISPPLIILSHDVEVQTLSDRLIQNWGSSGYMLEKEDNEGQKW